MKYDWSDHRKAVGVDEPNTIGQTHEPINNAIIILIYIIGFRKWNYWKMNRVVPLAASEIKARQNSMECDRIALGL